MKSSLPLPLLIHVASAVRESYVFLTTEVEHEDLKNSLNTIKYLRGVPLWELQL